jgi:hypothetical protein
MANRLQPPEEQVKRRVHSQVIAAYLFKFSKYQQGNAILDRQGSVADSNHVLS